MPDSDRTVPPIVIKKYANRRLYDTESSIYITLDTLAEMVRAGREFVVLDAKTGDDITRAVLTQIIVEEETKGRNMLPLAFLRQLIGFYGDSLQGIVPDYLEQMMSQFALQQQQMRSTVQRTMESLLPPGLEEVGRQNLAMMDRAMSLFSPFYRPPGAEPAHAASRTPEPEHTADEVAELRRELAELREALAARKADSAGPPVKQRA